MEPRAAIDVDTRQVLTRWCDATPVHDIAEELDEDPQKLTEYVEDYFSYRLPWGISRYLRIAEMETDTPITSPLTRNIAGMVKFGMPSPEAVWAMSAGIASRHTAQLIADCYLGQRREQTPTDFRKWLGQLDVNLLAERFGLVGAELHTTARAVLRAQPNDLFKKLDEGVPLLPLSARCIPLPSAYRSGLIHDIHEGGRLTLQRGLDNLIDRNAVLLTLQGQEFGRLAADVARMLAPDIDAGLHAEATVSQIHKQEDEITHLTVTIDNSDQS